MMSASVRSLLAEVESGRERKGRVGRSGDNTALVICTFPPGVSRWLKLDLVHRAERKVHVPVIHVVTEAAVQARR